jgi:ribosome biogenesis protein ERB1
MNPEELIPKIPEPSQLRPFPTALNIIYHGHGASVDALDVSPSGKYFITGDADGYLVIW